MAKGEVPVDLVKEVTWGDAIGEPTYAEEKEMVRHPIPPRMEETTPIGVASETLRRRLREKTTPEEVMRRDPVHGPEVELATAERVAPRRYAAAEVKPQRGLATEKSR
eukprot:7426381-Heterocapsa_arctica.AAC.1